MAYETITQGNINHISQTPIKATDEHGVIIFQYMNGLAPQIWNLSHNNEPRHVISNNVAF